MPWVILVISAVFEAVWATALGMSDGLSAPLPAAVFFAALAVSMAGLGKAAKHIPIGTAYAVWVGIGAVLTVVYAMATGAESVSAGKIVFMSGIIAAVVGLKLVPGKAEPGGDGADGAGGGAAAEAAPRS
ncbi:DMT family transporter [Nocardiopsis coralliicola]